MEDGAALQPAGRRVLRPSPAVPPSLAEPLPSARGFGVRVDGNVRGSVVSQRFENKGDTKLNLSVPSGAELNAQRMNYVQAETLQTGSIHFSTHYNVPSTSSANAREGGGDLPVIPLSDINKRFFEESKLGFSFHDKQNSSFETSKKVPGSGRWLIKNETFKEWRDGVSTRLWCYGMSGIGKTILTSIVVDHIETLCSSEQNTMACLYLYFDGANKAIQTPKNALMSLFAQLLGFQKSASKEVRARYHQWYERGKRVKVEELEELTRGEMTTFKKVFLVVDALDECSSHERDEFVDMIFRLSDTCGLNIFLTSRYHEETNTKMEGVSRIEITPSDIGRDLRGYVKYRITRDKTLKPLTKLAKDIVAKADGMFLLVDWYISKLMSNDEKSGAEGEHHDNDREYLLSKLKGLPASLEMRYLATMRKIQSQGGAARSRAVRILLWLSCHARPLEFKELLHAISIPKGGEKFRIEDLRDKREDYITSVCEDLVTVDPKTREVRFGHYTAMEYLEDNWNDLFPNTGRNIVAAELCLTYLLLPGLDRPDSKPQWMKRFAFLEYAADYWHTHLTRGQSESNIELAVKLLRQPARVRTIMEAMRGGCPVSDKGVTGLHLAVFLDLGSLVRRLAHDVNGEPSSDPVDGSTDTRLSSLLDAKTGCGERPLHWAVAHSRTEILGELISLGADVNATDGMGNSPLHTAVKERNEAAVKVLLQDAKGKVDINAVDKKRFTPLIWAAHYGFVNIAKALLDSGADIGVEDEGGWTALRWAASRNHKRLVELLIHRGANLQAHRTPNWSLLHSAIGQRNSGIVSVLMDEGDDVNHVTDAGTPMMNAILYKQPKIAFLLLEKANLSVEDRTGDAALHVAVKLQAASYAWLLLHNGADPNQPSKDGSTALHIAAGMGYLDIASLLVLCKADLEARDKGGRTPLHVAVQYHRSSIIQLLAENGANLEALDKENRAPLHIAVSDRAEPLVSLLLDRGANVDSEERHGYTSLHLATKADDESMMRILLDRRARRDSKSKGGWTPLHLAVRNGNKKTVAILLQAEADPDVADGKGQTALHSAIVDPKTKSIAEILVEASKNVDAVDEDGESALHKAISSGSASLVLRLLKKGASVQLLDGKGLTPLQRAIIEHDRHFEDQKLQREIGLVLWHLSERADVNQRGWQSRTAVHTAAAVGSEPALKILFRRSRVDPDINGVDDDGLTPELLAIKRGFTDIDWQAMIRYRYEEGS